MEIAAHLGLACRPLRIEVDHLGQLRLPAILHWDMVHFVVLKAYKKKGIVVYDPAAGEKWFPIAEASRHLTGVVLELSPSEEFCCTDQRVRLPFSAFWSGMRGNSHVLTQILVLSVVIEILILAAPFYMQLTVDEVIARGDVDLLLVLGLGFALLVLIKVASTATRSFIVLILQNTLSFQIGARLFHHLVRLPLSFFEKRHIGDILSRFGSIEPIRNMLAEGLITGLIDGLMSVLMLALMFAYSVQLGFVVLFAFALYAALRLALFRMFRQRSEAAIHSKAQENSTFIETVRAVQSLKLLNRENERESQWLNRYGRRSPRTRQPHHGWHDIRVRQLQAAVRRTDSTVNREAGGPAHSRTALGAPRRYCAHPTRAGARPGPVVYATDPRRDRTAQRVLPLCRSRASDS
jgi:ATP-binding cassette subfamily B protein RaxB